MNLTESDWDQLQRLTASLAPNIPSVYGASIFLNATQCDSSILQASGIQVFSMSCVNVSLKFEMHGKAIHLKATMGQYEVTSPEGTLLQVCAQVLVRKLLALASHCQGVSPFNLFLCCRV